MSARPASGAWLQPAPGQRVVRHGNGRRGRAPDDDAHAQLTPFAPTAPVDAELELKGFPSRHWCFQITSPPA